MTLTADFTYRSARSGAVTAGISIAILVETVALHALLMTRHPVLAWVLTASSGSILVWLIADYRAMGRGAVKIVGAVVELRIGRRAKATLPVDLITEAVRPGWRDLPAPGTTAAGDYLNVTKPATPNVLLTLAEPMTIQVAGLPRSARRIGMHLDHPEAFLASLERR